jgi:hypothetical protein
MKDDPSGFESPVKTPQAGLSAGTSQDMLNAACAGWFSDGIIKGIRRKCQGKALKGKCQGKA